MTKIAVDIDNFSYSFGNGDVLKAISFAVWKGEYISIVGPNGAGKTTLLKNIMRILSGGSGSIKVSGIDVRHFSQRELAKEVSYVPQADGRTYPFNVREFILISKYPYLNPFSRVGREAETEAESVLESVHMNRFKDREMSALSSGERQKIMIAASLMQRASILLLDEPTTFLDPKHEEEINLILKKLNLEKQITIISVTHNINAAAVLSGKILALKEGSVAYFGDPKSFMREDILSSLYEKDFKMICHPQKDIKIILPEII